MIAPSGDRAATDRQPSNRTLPARMIRAFAVPIILAWIALIAVLNVTVPQLEEVGQAQAVSMSPEAAPSMIAMKRIGQVFEEGNSDSSAMIVLEGQEPLGDAAHEFYDEMLANSRPTPNMWSRYRTSGVIRSPRPVRRAVMARPPTFRSNWPATRVSYWPTNR